MEMPSHLARGSDECSQFWFPTEGKRKKARSKQIREDYIRHEVRITSGRVANGHRKMEDANLRALVRIKAMYQGIYHVKDFLLKC